MKFTIEFDEQQMHVVARALENYARMGMGQLDVSVEEFLREHFYEDYYEVPTPKVSMPRNQGEVVKYHVDEVKDSVFGHTPNGSWSISNVKVPEVCREAWDICQVMRRAKAELYHEQNPGRHHGIDMGPYMATNPKLPPVKVTRLPTRKP